MMHFYPKSKCPIFRLNIGVWLISLHLGWVHFLWFKNYREIAFDYLAEYRPKVKA